MNTVDGFNRNQAMTTILSPIAKLSQYSDLMTFTLKHLTSQEVMASRTVCTRWNEIISTQCIAPILYHELELQVVPFLEHIGKTLEQYFLERGIPLSSLISVKDAYHCLGPIKWEVSLGDCLSLGHLDEITPESLMQNIQEKFVVQHWAAVFKWREDLYDLLSKLGFPPSTWNQLALALGVSAEKWNQQLETQLSAGLVDTAVAKNLKKLGVKPGTEEPDFNPLAVTEKMNAFLHNKVKGAPYFQLCALCQAEPPKSAAEFAFIDDGLDEDDLNDEDDPNMSKPARISFSVNNQLLYDYFPCTLLGFKDRHYVENEFLFLDRIIGKDFCFPINGQFFKFTICPAEASEWNPKKEQKSSRDSSSDDDYVTVNKETFDRDIEYNGWKCVFSGLYIPEDECERFKITR
jgi:hypothetical protein